MKTNLHKILLTGLFGIFLSAGASAETRTNKIMDKQSVIDSIVKPEKNLVIEREVTPKGDTIYRYKYQAVDLGPIEDKAPTILYKEEPKRALRNAMPALQSVAEKGNHYVGKIPFTEGVTPTGGKTYAIPILTAPCKGQAPQVAIAYNSQGGNGTAGYGWNVTGASAINVVGKTIHYDGQTAAVDLSKPAECAFALDGVRLVRNTGTLTQYDYETSQGFVLVKKHLVNGEIAYFTVAYPNGNTATFGFKNNTKTQPAYPITEMVDRNGYKINFEYTMSGNCHFLSRIAYGGRSEAEHTAEMQFNYEARKDFTTVYLSGMALAADKLLKSIVSRNKVGNTFEELCTYRLSHELKDVSQLVQIGCSSGGVEMAPLRFGYAYRNTIDSGTLQCEAKLVLSKYFKNTYNDNPLYIRGKFVKDHYSDGLVTMPNKYSPYTVLRQIKIAGADVPVLCGSGYPADQDILIAPGLSFYNTMRKIKTGSGFQTIQAADVDGDGVDEIVKVNFGDNSKDNTQLRISTYTCNDLGMKPTVFNIALNGVFSLFDIIHNPMSREYFFGDFLGTGKAQLLAISHDKTLMGHDVTSWFSLIDINGKAKISETTLFSFGSSSTVFPLDVNGDGKMELCHHVDAGWDVYTYSTAQNRFTKLYELRGKNAPPEYSNVFGDINGDGKMDILNPPVWSYHSYSDRDLPVWAPPFCPKCGKPDPILDYRFTDCDHCSEDLEKYYNDSPYQARCIKCNSKLGSTDWSVPPLSCRTHGDIVTVRIYNGYVDNGNKWKVFLSTGKSFEPIEMPIINSEQSDHYLLADVNQDGLADLVCARDSTILLYINHNGKISSIAESSLSVSHKLFLLPLSVCNPNGMSHLVSIEKGEVSCYRFTYNCVKFNLLTDFTDSYGLKHTNGYRNIIEDNAIYQPSRIKRTYPYCNLNAPLFLLSVNNVYDGNEPIRGNAYLYEGAVIHRTGLGFVGFETTNVEDMVTHTFTRERHDVERLGITTRTETRDRDVDLYYANTNFTAAKTCNPVLTRSVETNKLTGVKKETQLFYDAFNNPTRQRISFGNGNIYTESIQTYRNVTTSDRYLVGLPLAKATTSGRNGNTWTTREEYAYNAQWMPERSVTYTNGNKTGETRWTYDAHGNVTSEKSAPYNVTELLGNTYTYDAIGRNLLTKTNALGQTTTYAEYDKWGQAHRITDHKGRVTTIVTDAWGKPVSTTSPDGITTTTTTAWGGKGLYTIAKTITGKPKTIVHYDALEREVRKGNMRFDGKWQFVDNAYDYKGRLAKTSLPFKGDAPALWTTYEYDKYDRPIKQTEASGKTTTWSYAGLSVTETKEGIASTKTTDAIGELIKVEDPGGTITYTLRPDGQPSAITAPGNVITTFEYDGFGRRTAIVDPSAGRRSFSESYSADGVRTVVETNADGRSITSTYDKFGRATGIRRPEFNTAYTYNADGLLVREESTNGTSSEFTYDDNDRLATSRENVQDGKFLQKQYQYGKGNVTSISYASKRGNLCQERFEYANGYNVEIKLDDGKIVWKQTEENDLGQSTRVESGVLERKYNYTETGLPHYCSFNGIIPEYDHYPNFGFDYEFDAQTGNLLYRTNARYKRTENFNYDNLNRLEKTDYFSEEPDVVYSANGNIVKKQDVGALLYGNTAKPYQVTSVTPSGTAVPLRDQRITYTSFMRPKRIEENGYTASFDYTADADRTRMIVTHGTGRLLTRYYIGGRYECDVDSMGSEVERLYIGGDAYTASAFLISHDGCVGIVYQIVRDYLGSIVYITDDKGYLKQELDYDAWGRLRKPHLETYYEVGSEPELLLGRGYCGHEHLPWFGLINMNARLYDPVLGRFLSPDPYVQMPDFTQNFNRYSYCLNNPLKYVDKDGEFFHLIIGAIVGGIFNWASHGFQFNAKGLGYFAVGAAIGTLSAMGGAWSAAAFKAVGVAAGAGIGAVSGGIIGGASSFLLNGANNLIGGNNFFDNWKSSLISGAITGAITGAIGGGIAGGKEALKQGKNVWWGNEVKYGRSQWSFINTEKPYQVIDFDISDVGSLSANDCVPTSFSEANKHFGGNTSYENYKLKTNYINGKGVETTEGLYGKLVSDNFRSSRFSSSQLSAPGFAQDVLSRNGLIHVNMPYGGIHHADILRSIRYYHSGKIVMKFRIGYFKLSSVNDEWWFYFLRGLK